MLIRGLKGLRVEIATLYITVLTMDNGSPKGLRVEIATLHITVLTMDNGSPQTVKSGDRHTLYHSLDDG